MESNNLLSVEGKYLSALKYVFDKYKIPPSLYSLDGYQEGSSCIQKIDEKWICFDAERANKNKIVEYTSISDACIDIISRVALTKSDKFLFLSEFNEKLKNNQKESQK